LRNLTKIRGNITLANNYLNFYYFIDIEIKARKYFEEGLSSRKVYHKLSDEGIKCSPHTVKSHHKACNRGFSSYNFYLDFLAKERGFNDLHDYRRITMKKMS